MSATVLTYNAYRANEYAQITTPRIKTSGRYGALWVHPAGGNCIQAQSQPYAGIIETLAAAGYPVHNADYCAAAYQQSGDMGYNYGNSDHISAIGAGFTDLVNNGGAKAGKFFGVGASMGALGLANYAKGNPTNIGALVLIVFAGDLLQLYNEGAPGNGYIDTAYGIAGAPGPSVLNASSPAAYGAGALPNVPILLLSSDNDPVAMTTAQQQAWASGHSNITVQSMGAVGHTVPSGTLPSGLTIAQTILNFFDANGGRS